uniref:Uncharacterized protein n=1 Tax=Timema genevievae TaxID=629358 RepID=A0A7R9JSU8_TIMGE|nr:unnamed protein product [Timema genevievae]
MIYELGSGPTFGGRQGLGEGGHGVDFNELAAEQYFAGSQFDHRHRLVVIIHLHERVVPEPDAAVALVRAGFPARLRGGLPLRVTRAPRRTEAPRRCSRISSRHRTKTECRNRSFRHSCIRSAGKLKEGVHLCLVPAASRRQLYQQGLPRPWLARHGRCGVERGKVWSGTKRGQAMKAWCRTSSQWGLSRFLNMTRSRWGEIEYLSSGCVHVAKMAEAGPLEWACSLYISPTSPELSPRPQLESLIQSLQPAGLWQITETGCGYIVSFASESDAQNFLSVDIIAALDGSVQVAKFNTHDTRYKQIVLLRDVPWAIPLQDISEALTKQGISSGILERSRQHVRVEVLEPSDYECLLQQGLNFFGAIRFTAIPERCWKVGVPLCGTSNAMTICNTDNTQQDSVLQCYRCQFSDKIRCSCELADSFAHHSLAKVLRRIDLMKGFGTLPQTAAICLAVCAVESLTALSFAQGPATTLCAVTVADRTTQRTNTALLDSNLSTPHLLPSVYLPLGTRLTSNNGPLEENQGLILKKTVGGKRPDVWIKQEKIYLAKRDTRWEKILAEESWHDRIAWRIRCICILCVFGVERILTKIHRLPCKKSSFFEVSFDNTRLGSMTQDINRHLVIIAYMHDNYSKGVRMRKEAFERINPPFHSIKEKTKTFTENPITQNLDNSTTPPLTVLNAKGGVTSPERRTRPAAWLTWEVLSSSGLTTEYRNLGGHTASHEAMQSKSSGSSSASQGCRLSPGNQVKRPCKDRLTVRQAISTPSSFTEANLEDSQIGTIQSPGTVEDLHKKCKDLFPSVFEGAKLIVSNGINNHFQLSHTFTLSSEGGSGYRFGGTYVGTKMIGPNEAYPILQGDIDPRGNINGTVIHQFGPKLTSRLSAQIQNGKLSASQLTNDYKGDNCTCSLALANLDISKRAGVFVAHYLQSVSSNLALGSELVYQCGRNVPGGEMTMLSAVARYSLGDIVFHLLHLTNSLGHKKTSMVRAQPQASYTDQAAAIVSDDRANMCRERARANLMKDENGDLMADRITETSIWNNHFSHIWNVYERFELGEVIEIHTAELLVPEPSIGEVKERGVASPLSELSIMEWGLVLVLGVDRKLSLPDTEPGPRGDLPIDIPYGARPILELERIF